MSTGGKIDTVIRIVKNFGVVNKAAFIYTHYKVSFFRHLIRSPLSRIIRKLNEKLMNSETNFEGIIEIRKRTYERARITIVKIGRQDRRISDTDSRKYRQVLHEKSS